MKSRITCGIDIGTHTTRVIIARIEPDDDLPTILGVGSSDTQGMRNGYVINVQQVSQSVARALRRAENKANTRIKRASISIGGASLSSEKVQSSIAVSKADGEITDIALDQLRAQTLETFTKTHRDHRILHIVHLGFKLDSKETLANPLGMHGSKLEESLLVISVLDQHYNNLLDAVELAGIRITDVVASPLAANLAVLSPKQRMVGALLLDIGSQTITVSVFEDALLVSLEVIPLGGSDFTNDIALGFRVPLHEAEQLKLGLVDTQPGKRVQSIIHERLASILGFIQSYLKKQKRAGLLPGGVTIIGGGAAINSVDEIARDALMLPAHSIVFSEETENTGGLPDHTWFVAFGLTFPNLDQFDLEVPGGTKHTTAGSSHGVLSGIRGFFEQFLP